MKIGNTLPLTPTLSPLPRGEGVFLGTLWLLITSRWVHILTPLSGRLINLQLLNQS